MALREKIIEEERLAKEKWAAQQEHLKLLKEVMVPVSEADEAAVDELIRQNRPESKRKLGFTKEDSDRLMRIERMLVEVLKKIDL